ncbi:MAG: hypothetical protein H6839_08665 [Planctomycetes bacterium]|nr:hypothetical protein [Planctomycetota bacterium]
MRSSFTIFLIGLVLGSTLGIGGLWTQVVQPAYQEIKDLNEEHAVMESALNEAGETLREVAGTLRDEVTTTSAPEPILPGEIIPKGGGTSGVTPQPTELKSGTPRSFRTADRKQLADKLDALATKLDTARAQPTR